MKRRIVVSSSQMEHLTRRKDHQMAVNITSFEKAQIYSLRLSSYLAYPFTHACSKNITWSCSRSIVGPCFGLYPGVFKLMHCIVSMRLHNGAMILLYRQFCKLGIVAIQTNLNSVRLKTWKQPCIK